MDDLQLYYLINSAFSHIGTRNFASTNADNETFCTVLLTSQVVMIQSLQPKGREFESTCVFFYLYSIRLISFIIDVPRPLRNESLDHSISKG